MNNSKLITRAELPNFANLFTRYTTPSGVSIYLFKNVPTCIHRDISSVGNAGTGEDALHTINFPAGTLRTNKDYMKFALLGSFANNANNKRLEFDLDGNQIYNTGAFGITNRTWSAIIELVRITSTTIRTVTRVIAGDINRDATPTLSGNGFSQATLIGDWTVSNLDSTVLTFTVNAEATNDNDVTQHYTRVELCQQ